MSDTKKVKLNQDCYFNGEYHSKGDTVTVEAHEERNLIACGYIDTEARAPAKVKTQGISKSKTQDVKTK